MEKSEKIELLVKALISAEKKFSSILKNKDNPFFNSEYADLSAIIEATRPSLLENGIVLLQHPITEGAVDYLETVIAHESGQWISFRGRMNPAKNDPQGMGSAISYFRRYYQNSILNLGQKDDDGNASSETGPSQPAGPKLVKPSSAEYKMGIPKNRSIGKTLDEMGLKEVQADYGYWITRITREGKPASGAVKEFLDHAKPWLALHSKVNPKDVPDREDDKHPAFQDIPF